MNGATDNHYNFGASSSTIHSINQNHLNGSSDFILINSNNKEPLKKKVKSWTRKKIHGAFSKKILYRRLPILSWLPKYDKTCFVSDLIAGITVGLTVIPQALAYASIAGLSPEYGLYSSFLGCFVYIFLGSCKDASVGPTAIVSLLTYEAVKNKGPQHATLLCFLAGIMQVLMGVFGLGFLVDFISGPVSSGFISASAIVIISSQMKNFLGIQMSATEFIDIWKYIFTHIKEVNIWDAVLGATCLVILLLVRFLGNMKFKPSLGTSLNKYQMFINKTIWFFGISRNAILVFVCSALGYHFQQHGTSPIGLTGHVPEGLPTPQPPSFNIAVVKNDTTQIENFLDIVSDLHSGLIIVPLLGMLEQISICKVFAKGKAMDATQELLAIGFCNVANSFVHGFPISGALGRSAVNNASGVRTSLAGLYTGLLVIICLLFLTPYCYYIPKATLAAIIIAASFLLVEIKVLKPIWRAKKSDLIPALTTFICCLLLPLQYGILIGIGINLLSILYHAARPKISLEELTSPGHVKYLMITPDRCLIFPSVNYVKHLVTKHSLKKNIPVVIDCSHIYGADYTAATVIKTLIKDFLDRRQPLFFYNLKPSVGLIIDGLSPRGFVAYYKREDFDDLYHKWLQTMLST